MVQWIMVLATKSDDLSSDLRNPQDKTPTSCPLTTQGTTACHLPSPKIKVLKNDKNKLYDL